MAYNNNDIIVIPDIHGRQFWRRAVELYPDADTIFLGDYHDPYPAEGITNEESLANLRELLDYVKSHDNVHLLMGNHDLNYFADFGKKVRYDEKNTRTIRSLLTEILPRMTIATTRIVSGKTVFFSHSPVLVDWVKDAGVSDDVPTLVKTLNDSIKNLDTDPSEAVKLLRYVPSYRGGEASFGSPTWTDVRELDNDGKQIIDTIDYSIFAHTRVNPPRITSKWADLDSQRAFRLTQELKLIEI